MIGYFPPFYEDELFCSAIVRHHRHTMARSWIETLRDVYGPIARHVPVEFPLRLREFKRCVGELVPETVDEIVWNRTLLPYYAAFVGPDRQQELADLMMREDALRGSIYSRLGLAFCGIPMPKYMRTCRACLDEDAKIRGETYWRRSHQLQGVHFCARHAEILVETDIEIRPVHGHQSELHGADLNMRTRPYLPGISGSEQARLLRISELGVALLQDRFSGTLSEQRVLCLDRLHRAGFMKNSYLLDGLKLDGEFKNFYGDKLLELLHCTFEAGDVKNWVRTNVKIGRRDHHSLRRVLVAYFLGDCVVTNPSEVVICSGPWRCKNRAADHFGTPTITSYTTVKHQRFGRAGRFLCGCGYEFTARLNDVDADGQPIKLTVTRCGDIFVNKVHELFAKGYSRAAISRLLEINPTRVGTILRGSGDRRSFAGTPELAAKMRFSKAAHVSRATTSPKTRKVDWVSRDLHISKQVRLAAESILADEPPQRVTRMAIERLVGIRSLNVFLRAQKLPKTARELSLVTETVEAFQCRRAKWTYEHWPPEIPLTASRLRVSSSAPPRETSLVVDEFIERLVCNAKEN